MNDYYDDVTRSEQEAPEAESGIPAPDFTNPQAPETEPEENKGKKKKKKLIIALSSIVGILIVAAVLLFALKSPIHYSLALNYIGNNDYEFAKKAIENSDSDKADVLSDYIKLRVDFNKHYRKMLEEFDEEQITEWYDDLEKIKKHYGDLPDDVKAEIDDFSSRIAIIKDSLSVYSSIRYDIIDMMDIFAEINRLMAVDENGEKTPFTVNEVLKKVEHWKISCDNLNAFSINTPNGDTVYPLIYLISETYSECNEITAQMEEILVNYSGDDQITSAGEGQEQFPTITNSNGVTLSFEDPEAYEEYMRNEICIAMMRYLSVYYYGK